MGHTNFSPDWCFGLFKQAYRRARIGCLDDIIQVVESSAAVNHAQLVGTQDGKLVVPTYDWASFFDEPFRQRALKGIKLMHHLTFTHSKPGYMIVKDSVDSPERELQMAQDEKWTPSPTDLPPIIPPPGLSHERRQYLLNFDKIGEFCPEECQDLVYPNPAPETDTPPTPKRHRRHGLPLTTFANIILLMCISVHALFVTLAMGLSLSSLASCSIARLRATGRSGDSYVITNYVPSAMRMRT